MKKFLRILRSAKKPVCAMVFQDGGNYVSEKGQFRTTIAFDNRIHKKEMPVTIGIFINPGVFLILVGIHHPPYIEGLNRNTDFGEFPRQIRVNPQAGRTELSVCP